MTPPPTASAWLEWTSLFRFSCSRKLRRRSETLSSETPCDPPAARECGGVRAGDSPRAEPKSSDATSLLAQPEDGAGLFGAGSKALAGSSSSSGSSAAVGAGAGSAGLYMALEYCGARVTYSDGDTGEIWPAADGCPLEAVHCSGGDGDGVEAGDAPITAQPKIAEKGR